MYRRKRILRHFAITMIALTAALPAMVLGQETRPAEPDAPALTTLTARVWTCPRHQQFRMGASGVCPLCDRELVEKQVTLQDSISDPYPLKTCPVSGLNLGSIGEPIVMIHEGREVRFCRTSCIREFKSDVKGYLQKIDDEIIKQQLASYPMTTCPVSGEALDSMGGSVDYVFNNRLVRFCCKGCRRSFKKDPAPFLATLDAAVLAQQTDGYPLKKCPISGLKLSSMGEPIDYLIANRLVRFCCDGCAAGFFKAPAVHLEKLDKAWRQAGGIKKGPHNDRGDHDNGDHDHDH